MALKSTICKATINVADIDRNYYADHALTIARHPSETDERMMLRLLAFACHADEALTLCKGISDADEPDLWQRDLTGAIVRWIELGQPDERRIAKACGRAAEVLIYAYGRQSTRLWWQQTTGKLGRFSNLKVIAISPESVRELGLMAKRSISLQATIQDGQVLLSDPNGAIQINLEVLHSVA